MWSRISHRVQQFVVRNRKDSVIPHNLHSQSLLQDYNWVNKPQGEGSSACVHRAVVCNCVLVHSHYCACSSIRTLLRALIFCTRISQDKVVDVFWLLSFCTSKFSVSISELGRVARHALTDIWQPNRK